MGREFYINSGGETKKPARKVARRGLFYFSAIREIPREKPGENMAARGMKRAAMGGAY